MGMDHNIKTSQRKRKTIGDLMGSLSLVDNDIHSSVRVNEIIGKTEYFNPDNYKKKYKCEYIKYKNDIKDTVYDENFMKKLLSERFIGDTTILHLLIVQVNTDDRYAVAIKKILDACKLHPTGFDSFIETKDQRGNTALHYATFLFRYDTVKILLKNGSDPLMDNMVGRTCVQCIRNNNAILIDIYRKYNNGPDKRTVNYCLDTLVQYIEEREFEVDREQKKAKYEEKTALSDSYMKAFQKYINMWAKNESDYTKILNMKMNENERTLLHIASIGGNNIFRLLEHILVSAKPEVLNRVDIYGATALHYACFMGHDYIIGFLLSQRDIDISTRDSCGNTALDMFNIKNKQHMGDHIFDWILKRFIDLNQQRQVQRKQDREQWMYQFNNK